MFEKKYFYFTFFLDRPLARIWVIWVQIQIFSKKKKIKKRISNYYHFLSKN